MPYSQADLVTDETAQAEAILTAIKDLIDGWEPQEGSIETQLAEVYGIAAATATRFVADNADDAYVGFGELIVQLARKPENPASGPARWTVKDTAGYVIPSGSEVIFDSPTTGNPVAFHTIADAFVGTGDSTVDVTIVAVEAGEEANNASGAGRDFEALTFVTAVDLLEPTADGAEEETVEAYRDRVVDHTRRLKAVPIVTADYPAFSLDVPGVARAAAINLLNPDSDPEPPPSTVDPEATLDDLGHLTVFGLDEAGTPIDSVAKGTLHAYLTADERPLGVTVHVADAEITDLTAEVHIRLDRDADEDTVVPAVQAAITSYFDPATWDYSVFAPGLWEIPVLDDDRTVRAYDLAHIADSQDGVAYTFHAEVNGGDEVLLTGWAPLPNLTAPPTVVVLTG